MIAEAGRGGRVLMVAQVVRFMAPYRVAADMLRGGKLGPVRAASFRRRCAAPAWSQWLSDPAQSGGGVFDLLVHDVDFCVQLFGMPASVSARGYVDIARGIDWIAADLRYPGIGAVTVSGGWHHPRSFPFSMEYTIVADGGTLEYSSAGVPPALYGADGNRVPLALPDVDGYQQEVEYFVACASEGRAPTFCPPSESAAAVKLARLMTESRDRNGVEIPCEF
jgi:predicted dehydrogenase